MPILSTTKTIFLDKNKKKDSFDFDAVKVSLASPSEILSWSSGEVTKPETINYRSQKPERDGLFCQKIFGPAKDWECACGKYKGIRYRGIVCDRCGVEVTRSFVRRERMGHIQLAAPVVHIWFFKGLPSKIGLLLNISIKILEKVIYFASFIVTSVKEDLKQEALEALEQELKIKKKALKDQYKNQKEELEKQLKSLTSNYNSVKKEIESVAVKKILNEEEYHDLSMKYGHFFEAKIGAEAITTLLEKINLKQLIETLEKDKRKTDNPQTKKKIIDRIKLVSNFIKNKIEPQNMVLKVLPVIPPDLRPLVELEGGRFASSDLNDLYRRVINRNNRLKKLYELQAPEVIIRNEKRMLQEAVDSLLDNSMRAGKTTALHGSQKRPLKSLADILRGKEGRFRRNLLGKRVDYSGRSVIVVGPHLKLGQCGLPKMLALEIYKPFIAARLISQGIVHNIKSANHKIDDGDPEVWDILEEIIKDSLVLLNRAPTLHRLGILAFRPILIEGKAIQIHPLVCDAYNADFDGDMMGVHLPISAKAKKEAEDIIWSVHNLLKPATGQPIMMPLLDIVLGIYYLTSISQDSKKDNQLSFSSPTEAIMAYNLGRIGLQEEIKVRTDNGLIQATVGRILVSEIFPWDLYRLDKVIDKKYLELLINSYLRLYGQEKAVLMLDQLKDLALKYVTLTGMTFSVSDFPKLEEKQEIVEKIEKEVEKNNSNFKEGLLSEHERYSKNIEAWSLMVSRVSDLVKKKFSTNVAPYFFVSSGAKGNWGQIIQMVGAKGLVSSPTGKIIELPLRSSYRDGLDNLEYFVSTHGARKGIVDKALRTAEAGYLTRRLVDVAQELIVIEEDCKTDEGIYFYQEDNKILKQKWSDRIFGRYLAEAVEDPKTGKVIFKKGALIDFDTAQEINKIDPLKVCVRSVLRCESHGGVCSKCYGYDLGYNEPVKRGATIGIVAGQSIGEPGTQLTLRTFHVGGVAGKDITQGLPRVEELIELHPPKTKALMAFHDGKASVVDDKGHKIIKINYHGEQEERHIMDPEMDWQLQVKNNDYVKEKALLAESEKTKIFAKHEGKIVIDDNVIKIVYNEDGVEEYLVKKNYAIYVKDGDDVKSGQCLTEGSLDLHELYELKGKEEVERYMLRELVGVYLMHTSKLDNRHFEVIIRQMFSRCLIVDSGDTSLFPGSIVSKFYKKECDEQVKKNAGKPAQAKELFLGVTKTSLAIDSWLAAASFQETSRILIDAAITGRVDHLRGLKENVIIGKLMPAGTGLPPKKEAEASQD